MARPGGNPLLAAHKWKPGQSGNPSGRPNMGLTSLEWMNALRESTQADLEAIVTDPEEPSEKVIAANQILTARVRPVKYREGRDEHGNAVLRPVGELREPGAAYDRIMDRTVGKPAQTILSGQAPPRTIEDAMGDLERLLAENPEVRAALADKLAAIMPVNTTAKALPTDSENSPGDPENAD